MKMEAVVGRTVQTMQAREREGKPFGVIVMSEGLSQYLPEAFIKDAARDGFGNISLSQIDLAEIFAEQVGAEYGRRTGKRRRTIGVRLG
jgi:6-phosphofructokinase 1